MDKPLKLKFRIKSDTCYARAADGGLDFTRGTVHISLMLNQGEVFTQAFPFIGLDHEPRVESRGRDLIEQKFANALSKLMAAEPDIV